MQGLLIKVDRLNCGGVEGTVGRGGGDCIVIVFSLEERIGRSVGRIRRKRRGLIEEGGQREVEGMEMFGMVWEV